MQKILKRLFVILMSAIAITCFALLAACQPNDDEFKEEDGKIVITVVYPDGSPVNGHVDGTKFDSELNLETVVQMQFCTTAGSCSSLTPTLGENGKIKLDIQNDILGMFTNLKDDDEIEFHVLGLEDYSTGEGGIYGKFKKNEIPSKQTITLKEASAD